MKKIIALLFAAGLSLSVAHTPAKASNFDLGTLSTDTTGFVANFGSNIKTFTDTIYFSLADVSNSLIGSITDLSSIFGQVVNSVNFSLDLFKVGDDTTLGHYADATGTGISFNYADLAAGDYFFRISGDPAGAAAVRHRAGWYGLCRLSQAQGRRAGLSRQRPVLFSC